MAVLLETSKGDIVIDLFVDDCPITSRNFIKLCKWVDSATCMVMALLTALHTKTFPGISLTVVFPAAGLRHTTTACFTMSSAISSCKPVTRPGPARVARPFTGELDAPPRPQHRRQQCRCHR